MDTIWHYQAKRETVYRKQKFTKAQIASSIATAVDYLFLITLVELMQIGPAVATGFAAFLGANIHFQLSRGWVFDAKEGNLKIQMIRYILIAIGSALLNSLGVYIFTEIFLFPYLVSKIIISLAVAWGYNFLLHRFFVFR